MQHFMNPYTKQLKTFTVLPAIMPVTIINNILKISKTDQNFRQKK